ncbi:MAG: YdcF family protein [Alphaproteobacteria bacterium]
MSEAPIRRGRVQWALIGLVAAAALWLGGLVWYANDIPRAVDDPTTRTDAVVVLTGGSGRVDVGLALLAERRAQKLLVTGVGRDVDLDQLLKVSMRQDARFLKDRIALGHEAGDTTGNAREAADWMAREGFSSLRLVTASYHMRRSLLEFRRALPDARIVAHPVFPSGFRLAEWWRWPGTLSLLTSEYSKFLIAAAAGALGIELPETPQAAPKS